MGKISIITSLANKSLTPCKSGWVTKILKPTDLKGLRYCPEDFPRVKQHIAEQINNSPLVKNNEIMVRPKITKVLSEDFESKKQALIDAFGKDSELITQIKHSNSPKELATTIEKHQTELLLNGGKYKLMIEDAISNAPENVKYWQNQYLNSYYKHNESVYKTEHIFAQRSTNPKVIRIEQLLKEKYGLKFVTLSDDLKQGKKILKACKLWKASGEKIPEEIIVTNTIPYAEALGQSLRLPNGKTFILFQKTQKTNLKTRIHENLSYLNIICKHFNLVIKHIFSNDLKYQSTNSKYHTYIHEFAHSTQPLSMIKQEIQIPTKYQSIANNISIYGCGSTEELYAELKTLSILNPPKMTDEAWELLKYLESFS